MRSISLPRRAPLDFWSAAALFAAGAALGGGLVKVIAWRLEQLRELSPRHPVEEINRWANEGGSTPVATAVAKGETA